MRAKVETVLAMIGIWFIVNIFLVSAWITVSCVDVMIHNLNPDYIYPWWNLFELIF